MIKSAASLLVRGGTLVADPCPNCGGVQVRFANKNTCISCGKKQQPDSGTQMTENIGSREQVNSSLSDHSSDLSAVAINIQHKIASLALQIRDENDISLLKQEADLLESLLRILSRIRAT